MMRADQAKAFQKLLMRIVPKDKTSSIDVDAIGKYIVEVSDNEDEAIKRVSGILGKDVGASYYVQGMINQELLREKVNGHNDRLRALEEKEKKEDNRVPVLQSIFMAISFVASVVALLKAFNLLKLPW